MKLINHSIIGGGLSALIKDQISKKALIFYSSEGKIKKSNRFYEFDDIGGNTNIWGGYINYKRFNYLKKNKKFKIFFEKTKLFKPKKFIENENFSKTYYLCEKKNNKVFRIKKNNFKNRTLDNKINDITINKNYIILNGKKKYKTKHLSCCIGNLSLIELLYNSNLIKSNDKINFYDGNCSYSINIFKNLKKNYYIPMTIFEIIKKLLFGKIKSYDSKITNSIILQNFSNKYKKYECTVDEVISFKSQYIRFFLSNHVTNLSINNVPISNFIKKKSSRIKIYNSGICKKYSSGPISQDIIFNALNK